MVGFIEEAVFELDLEGVGKELDKNILGRKSRIKAERENV